jgi:hypothetical protein
MSFDQMSVDQMSVDQMSVDQMSVDQMSVVHMFWPKASNSKKMYRIDPQFLFQEMIFLATISFSRVASSREY